MDDLLRWASDAADAVLYLWERNNWITSAEIAADALLDIRCKSISRKRLVISKRINHTLRAMQRRDSSITATTREHWFMNQQVGQVSLTGCIHYPPVND